MGKLEECTERLLLLASGSTPTSRVAARAGVLAGDYWDLLDANQRKQLRHWLDTFHADSLRPTFGSAMKEKLRVSEMALGAITALERKAPPEPAC